MPFNFSDVPRIGLFSLRPIPDQSIRGLIYYAVDNGNTYICSGSAWFIIVGGVSTANSTVIYVSSTGSDVNDGLTWSKAKLTIQAAINAAPATGATIVFGSDVVPVAATVIGKNNIELYGYRAGRDGVWTCTTLDWTGGAAPVFDFRDCDHWFIHGVRIAGHNNATYGIRGGYTAGAQHVAFAGGQDVTIHDINGTAMDTGSGFPAGAMNDCFFDRWIIERCAIGYDWYSTNNEVKGGVVAGCTTAGMRHNESTFVKVTGNTVFSGNAIDHLLTGDIFVTGISSEGWYETAAQGIVKRTHVPATSKNVGLLEFIGCQLSCALASPSMFDLTNINGDLLILGARVDPGASLNVIVPTGAHVIDIGTDYPLVYSGAGSVTKLRSGLVQMPPNTRKGMAVVLNDANGDSFGMEMVSAAQTGDGEAALRHLTSFTGAYMSFGKYTSPTAFTEWARFKSTGELNLGDFASGFTALGVSILTGTGVPNNAWGVNGDMYLRKDPGAAGTHIYQKGAGAWVGLV